MKMPYPRKIIKLYNEAYIRCLSYILVYILTYYDIRIALFLLFGVILLHIDYINLVIN